MTTGSQDGCSVVGTAGGSTTGLSRQGEEAGPLASALKASRGPAIPRASEACGHAIAGEESRRHNFGRPAEKLVVRWADEATSDGEEADGEFLGRDGAKARWTSCSGRAIQFAKSDVGDNVGVCNLEIAFDAPLRLSSGGKEECNIKDHISQEDRHQEAAAIRVTKTKQQESVASVTRVAQVHERAWSIRSEQSTRSEGRVEVSHCVAQTGDPTYDRERLKQS